MITVSREQNVWVTSDWHFFHDKDFCYAARGYKNAEEMTNKLIDKYNEVVGPDDVVFCLGDCMMGRLDSEKVVKTLSRLNGRIYLILGNHDSDKKVNYYNECNNIYVVGYAQMVKWGEGKRSQYFYLSHYPSLCANYDDDKALYRKIVNICGHTHTKDKFADMDKGYIYHAEVDAHNGYPITLEQVQKDILAFEKK